MRTLCTTLAALVLASLPAHAADWYVDATSGNNANTGTSPSDAWQTITHSLTQLPVAGDTTLHVAAGTYDAALGETFNWHIRPRLSFAGAGPGLSIIDATGSIQVFIYDSDGSGACWNFESETVLKGLTIQNAVTGVVLSSTCGTVQPLLRDLEITGMWSQGVLLSNPSSFGGSAAIRGFRLNLHDNGTGLHTDGAGTITDSSFSNNLRDGVRALDTTLTLRRCRLEGNGWNGARISAYQVVSTLRLEDCLLAGNLEHGALGNDTAFGSTNVDMIRCTVTGNAMIGLWAEDLNIGGGQSGNSYGTLESSILYGNGDDLEGQVTATWSDIGDGDFNGTSGNFSADPLFRDAAGGDYRLSWGSPCADAGDPTTPLGTLDFEGLARPIDGDLDTLEAPDVGAFELATLYSSGEMSLGTFLELSMEGPSGSPLTLFWTRTGLVSPTVTSFGEFDLDQAKVNIFLQGQVPPSGTPLYRRKLPPAPFLVGRTFSWQARVNSPAAPSGQSYTSAVEITIVP